MELDFDYQYTFSSSAFSTASASSFLLSHCSEIEEDNAVSCFFYGNIISSTILAKCLSVLGKTVASHYALTPGQIARLKDPIVSVGNKQLHFEAFSSCNSVYASVDVLSDAVDGEFLASGCTNIDFNAATIRGFNAVSSIRKMQLSIGAKQVEWLIDKQNFVEKKVSLPNRWIKGLANVQVYLSQMELAFSLTKIEAVQLFQTLPRTAVKGDYYLSKNAIGYTFTAIPTNNSIKIGGIHRLNLLQQLLLSVDQMHVYKTASEQSVSFALDFKSIRMSFVFSESIYRGFSGEGLQLEHQINSIPVDWIIGINNFFKANEIFNPTLISIENDIPFHEMDGLQASLSSIGLLGYNVLEQQYFYRRLPFKLDRLISFQPRLQNAKKIFEKDEVTILIDTPTYLKALVKGSSDVAHTVIGDRNTFQCTCNWYTNNKNNRGLCKHILAVKMSSY